MPQRVITVALRKDAVGLPNVDRVLQKFPDGVPYIACDNVEMHETGLAKLTVSVSDKGSYMLYIPPSAIAWMLEGVEVKRIGF